MPDERFMRHHYGASGYVRPGAPLTPYGEALARVQEMCTEGYEGLSAENKAAIRDVYHSLLDREKELLDLTAELAAAREAVLEAEKAIAACPALKEWGPGRGVETHASRVTFLTNYYNEAVHTISLLADHRDACQALAARACEALRKLKNECRGTLGLVDSELRLLIGNTNVSTLNLRCAEAAAILSAKWLEEHQAKAVKTRTAIENMARASVVDGTRDTSPGKPPYNAVIGQLVCPHCGQDCGAAREEAARLVASLGKLLTIKAAAGKAEPKP